MKYSITEKNIHIENSYLCKDPDVMNIKLDTIRAEAMKASIIYHRSNKSWIREWLAHNWLYNHGIEVERTAHVDLNEDESLIRRLGYFIIALLFCR